MSQNIGRSLFVVMGLCLILPLVIVIIVLETFGVLEYVLPVIMPMFFSIILMSCVVGLAVIRISRLIQRSAYTSTDGLTSSLEQQNLVDSSEIPLRRRSGFFMIPLYCPHCGNPLDLQRVDWSSSRTLTCPSCYHEIDVKIA